MSKSHSLKNQDEVAKGGLLDRRKFLASGASFLSVLAASSMSSSAIAATSEES